MKILKSKKALSPVVASIILIAVTVAVSIAVAAWMGALTFSFFGGAEEIKIMGVTYTDNTTKKVYIEVMNTGSGMVTISDIRIDDTTYTAAAVGSGTLVGDILPYDMDKGTSYTFEIQFTNWPFVSGVKYEFTVITAKGNIFGPYTKAAPS